MKLFTIKEVKSRTRITGEVESRIEKKGCEISNKINDKKKHVSSYHHISIFTRHLHQLPSL